VPISLEESIVGCILGTAVGDAMGLPTEALSRRRLARYYPQITSHRFFFGRGMVSDDTEHTCMVAQALLVSGGEVEAFRKDLARRLRYWLLGVPASIGLATARALVKLWLGFSPENSGVFSAGNGPAMRSGILGAAFRNETSKMRKLVRASTRITHRDPKAEYGALAVALAAQLAALDSAGSVKPKEYQRQLKEMLQREAAGEFLELTQKAVESVGRRDTTETFAESLGLSKGVSGYVYHSVPVALHSWMSNQGDFQKAILETIRCGGDTDTVAAIVGGIIGAGAGPQGIPEEWMVNLWEWPRTVEWMQELGLRLAETSANGRRQSALRISIAGLFARNLFFLVIVLAHGFRRIFPPY
jgi:ADP-ribosylglycohydrolase